MSNRSKDKIVKPMSKTNPWKKKSGCYKPVKLTFNRCNGGEKIELSLIIDPGLKDAIGISSTARREFGLASYDGKTIEEINSIMDSDPAEIKAELGKLTFACMVAQCMIKGPELEGGTLGARAKNLMEYLFTEEIVDIYNSIEANDFSNFF